MCHRKPENDVLPALYASGLSIGQISAQTGMSKGAVYSALKKRGVTPRSYDEGIAIRYPHGRTGSDAGNWRGGRTLVPRSKRGARGSESPNWRGGRHVCKHGKFGEEDDAYIHVYKPDHPAATKRGYVMEHRLVMEDVLGRHLTRNEVVHHKNGKKTDNRPENLEVLSRGQHVHTHFKAIGSLDDAQRRIAALEAEVARLRQNGSHA